MTTLQDVLSHITGHSGGLPRQISWSQDFTKVQNPRDGKSHASTQADIGTSYSFSSKADPDGRHRLTNVRVTVAMNKGLSWVVSGKETPALLGHEQGHYSITWIAARELCRRLLDIEWDDAVLDAINESSPKKIVERLKNDAAKLTKETQTEITKVNKLYDDPVVGAKDASGVIIPAAQARWDHLIDLAVKQDTNLALLIAIVGGNPRTF